MILRLFHYHATACASYLFGCSTRAKLAVVDPHVELVDDYVATATEAGLPIVAVLETHVQADHVSGLPALVEATGATAYLPAGAGVDFPHVALADGDVLELGNTIVRALSVPGHAPAHHAYIVADRRRTESVPVDPSVLDRSVQTDARAAPARPDGGTASGALDEPWLVFTGDSLLVGDVGRPDLHANGDAGRMARMMYDSLQRLLELPDHVVVLPGHYGSSVCGRSLSGNPVSTIGFERRHNRALRHESAESFAAALLADLPPAPADQAQIVAANRSGLPAAAR